MSKLNFAYYIEKGKSSPTGLKTMKTQDHATIPSTIVSLIFTTGTFIVLLFSKTKRKKQGDCIHYGIRFSS